MKIKTQDLIGPALDWAVAKCEGRIFSSLPSSKHYFSPSTVWAHGGPIIEREKIATQFIEGRWIAFTHAEQACIENTQTGPTPLVAAMRCYVESKLGDEVEVPDDLA